MTNWMNKRKRLTTDKIRGQIFRVPPALELLADDGEALIPLDAADVWISVRWRRFACIKERRMITKQTVAAAKIKISGKTKRRIRTALELSRLKDSNSRWSEHISLPIYRSRPKYWSVWVSVVPANRVSGGLILLFHRIVLHTIIKCMAVGLVRKKNWLKDYLSNDGKKTDQTHNND